MPNYTPATAAVISLIPYSMVVTGIEASLPGTLTPSCGDAGHPLWWVFTPTVANTAVGIRVTSSDPTDYEPIVSFWTGPDVSSLSEVSPDLCTVYGDPTEFQCNTPVGVPLYLQVSCDFGDDPTGHSLTFELVAAPLVASTAGDLLVSNDTTHFPTGLIAASDGELLQVFGFPAYECADTASNVLCIAAEDSGDDTTDDAVKSIRLYDSAFRLIASDTSLLTGETRAVSPIRSNRGTTFYVSSVDEAFPVTRRATVGTISTAGVVGGTSWELPADADNMTAMAPARDGSILYYGGGSAGDTAIHRYDLVADAPLSDLVASLAGTSLMGRDMFVLADGTLLVVLRLATGNTQWRVRQYNTTTGATIRTFTLPTSVGSSPRIDLGIDDPVSFWAMTFPTGASAGSVSTFTHFDVATGATIDTITSAQKNATNNEAPMFGISQSCPLTVLPFAITLHPAPERPDTTEIPIRWERITPTIESDGKRVRHVRLEVMLQAGVGTPTGSGVDPIINVQSSDDGGATWSNIRVMSVGETGQYTFKTKLYALGSAYRRCYKLWGAQPVPFVIVKVFVDALELDH